MQVTWLKARRWITIEARRSSAPRSTASRSRTWLFKGSYNGGDLTLEMGSRALDRDPTAARRCIFKRYSTRINPSPSSRSDGHDIFETVHDGPFHRNRRSFRLDGYTQMPYKNKVFFLFVSIRVRNKSN